VWLGVAVAIIVVAFDLSGEVPILLLGIFVHGFVRGVRISLPLTRIRSLVRRS